MPWEMRGKGSGPYYYQWTKVAGKAHRQYLGKGERARQAAAQVAQRQAERAAQAEAVQAAKTRFQSADAALQELGQLTDLLTRAALESQGFFQHNRGAWRRKRDRSTFKTDH